MTEHDKKVMSTWAKSIESVRQKERRKEIHEYWIDKAGGRLENCMVDDKAYAENKRELTQAKMELTALVASSDYDTWKTAVAKHGGQDAARLYDLIVRKVLLLSEKERAQWIQEQRPLPIGYSLSSDGALAKVTRDFKTVGDTFIAEQRIGEQWVAELSKVAGMLGINNDDLLWVKGLASTHSTLPIAQADKVSFAAPNGGAHVASILKDENGNYSFTKEAPAVAQEMIRQAQQRPSPSEPVPLQSISHALDRIASMVKSHQDSQAGPSQPNRLKLV
jgi:hypothetical protein